jgi:hypothetical protein
VHEKRSPAKLLLNSLRRDVEANGNQHSRTELEAAKVFPFILMRKTAKSCKRTKFFSANKFHSAPRVVMIEKFFINFAIIGDSFTFLARVNSDKSTGENVAR